MKLLRTLHQLLTAALTAFCPLAVAQTGHSEAPYFDALPVVLTVSRMPQPQREAPASITVIDRDLIRATGYRDIGRLMRLVPGMQVAQEGGNDQWVSYHGPGTDYPKQMQVLVDGRALYSPYFGGAFAGALPLAVEDIERIEVVRGTDAASYGSQAFDGVVNIITRHTAEETGNSAAVRLGSGGIAGAGARVVARQGPLGVRVSAQHERDDGMAGLHDGRAISRVNVRGDLQLGTRDELSLVSGLVDSERQKGYPNTPFNSNPEREASAESQFVQLRWRHAPSSDEEFILSAYYTRERARDDWLINTRGFQPLIPRIDIPVDENNTAQRQNVEFQHHFAPAAGLRLGWGGEWRRDVMKAPFLFHGAPTQAEEMRRLFGNLEWRADHAWLLNVGMMAEHAQHDRTRIGPRVFLNWLPDAAQTWRVGYSRAYRQANMFDRRSDVRIFLPGTNLLLQQRHVPNPDVEPPRIDAFELGFLGQLPDGRAKLDVRLFHERVSDQIRRTPIFVAPTNPLQARVQALLPPSRWTNRDDVIKVEGVEYQLEARPWEGGRLLFSHTLIRARSSDEAIRRSVAPYTASLTWLQRAGPWQTMLTWLRMGPLDAGTGFSPDFRYSVPNYTTLDASIAREFRLANGRSVELRLTGLNLLGRHQELAHYPLQRLAGDKPVNRVEPQLALSLQTEF